MAKSKEKIPVGVRQELDDIDYWNKLKRSKEVVKLNNNEELTVYEYMKRFMHEAYGNNFSRDDKKSNILQKEEHKKWARRNNNNTNRDALNVSKKMLKLSNNNFLIEKGKKEETEEWELTFKTGTYEETLTEILKLTCKELDIPLNKKSRQVLFKFFCRIKLFLKYIRKEQK